MPWQEHAAGDTLVALGWDRAPSAAQQGAWRARPPWLVRCSAALRLKVLHAEEPPACSEMTSRLCRQCYKRPSWMTGSQARVATPRSCSCTSPSCGRGVFLREWAAAWAAHARTCPIRAEGARAVPVELVARVVSGITRGITLNKPAVCRGTEAASHSFAK